MLAMVVLISRAELDIERYKRWLGVLAFSSVVGTALCLRSSIVFSYLTALAKTGRSDSVSLKNSWKKI